MRTIRDSLRARGAAVTLNGTIRTAVAAIGIRQYTLAPNGTPWPSLVFDIGIHSLYTHAV
jgi:hypothetical protein